MKLPFQLLFLGALLSLVVAAPKPVKNLHVTFIGKKYDVEKADTAEDVQNEVQRQCGADSTTCPKVVFGGKPLEPTAFLRDVGVKDGDELSMIPDTTSSMQDLMKQAGVDTDKLDELMGGMGGSEGMPSMEESMKMMSNMMNSPMIQEMMSDPERLEQSRQMILQNPMLKSMMAGMPGMEELLNDPVAWREAMEAAANMYKNMDSNDLMNAMMGGAGMNLDGSMPPGAGGLFDGNLNNNAAAALDELSEGDD
ncbi:UBQ [Seminavis robusta]|uniref:UBQ n=1 Tax=Seminavis robusta TaxID=568900 RepID=A0A9N8HGL3_9STRA|nr:UBQ [Seminavis robusta]|eukprot:Sro490_g153540.1 UBQ (252) ;mRNA; f:42955-43897